MNGPTQRVLWAELFPDEFETRLAACPVVYLPLGLCEPHGPVAALGLDLVKAEALCARAAQVLGGIVAPSGGYHIHECGYHARWLEEVVGDANAHMTAVSPSAMLHFFLFQLRAFCNAGFAGAMVLTGHAGGNEEDLRRVAQAFGERFPMQVVVRTDGELAHPQFQADHAGMFEISELMFLRPELVDMNRLQKHSPTTGLHRTLFALGSDAHMASAHQGEAIVRAILHSLQPLVAQLCKPRPARALVSYQEVEDLWHELLAKPLPWATARPKPGQAEVSSGSQWKPFERL